MERKSFEFQEVSSVKITLEEENEIIEEFLVAHKRSHITEAKRAKETNTKLIFEKDGIIYEKDPSEYLSELENILPEEYFRELKSPPAEAGQE